MGPKLDISVQSLLQKVHHKAKSKVFVLIYQRKVMKF
jgi:hypothetical protein